jgi:putative transposase
MVAGAWFGRIEKAKALRRAQALSITSASLEGFGISETCCRYSPKLKDETAEIADLLVGLTDARKTWGFGLCILHLRNVKRHPWNHKRVYLLAGRRLPAIAVRRIYCALELNLRIKPRKRLKRDKPGAGGA